MKRERFEGTLHHTDYHYDLYHRQVMSHAIEVQIKQINSMEVR